MAFLSSNIGVTKKGQLINGSTIERLYNGEIYPAEQIVPIDPNYRPLTLKTGEERESQKKKLSGEDMLDDKMTPIERRLPVLKKHMEQADIYFRVKRG